MTARRKARKRALDILFESDLRGLDPVATAAARLALADPPVPDYAVELVEGVVAQRGRIDELITTYAEGWTLERLPGVDRALMRIAIFELLCT
ncbi:MAG: transcription antitermination protein NusB, partial [Geodermatophilaceae bacterium]|nr:transcription antitermination protein NusB [Geodermatophilaceae bacterium]